jgi:hypothetical protein
MGALERTAEGEFGVPIRRTAEGEFGVPIRRTAEGEFGVPIRRTAEGEVGGLRGSSGARGFGVLRRLVSRKRLRYPY